MKINKDKKKLNKYILAVAGLILAAGLYCGVAFFTKSYPFNSPQSSERSKEEDKKVNDVNYEAPKTDQQQAGVDAKRESEEKPSPSAPTTDSAQIAITSYNQQNGMLELRTTISVIDNSGRCVLSMKKAGSQTITQEVGTQSMGSYSVCAGFDVPTSNMSKGNWAVEIKYTGSSSAAVNQNIGIE